MDYNGIKRGLDLKPDAMLLYELAFTQINCLAVDLKRKQNKRIDSSFTTFSNGGGEKDPT